MIVANKNSDIYKINIENFNIDHNSKKIISKITNNKKYVSDISKGFFSTTKHLNKDTISIVEFNNQDITSRISYEEKEYFNINNDDFIHKSIEMVGVIRSLDKKTNKGKFVDINNNIYDFELRMNNPNEYHRYYIEDKVTIHTIATIDKVSDRIEKLEIENIE